MLLQASQSCSRPPCAPYARADQISHPCPPSQSLDKILGFFRDSGLGQLVLPWPAHGRHQKSAQRNQSQFRPDGIENPVRRTKGHISRPCPRLTKSDIFFWARGLGNWCAPRPARGRHQQSSAQRQQSQYRPDRIENPVRRTKGHISRPCPRLTKSDIFFWARGLGNWCAPRPARGRHQQSSAQRQQSQYRPDRIENPVRRTKGHISRPVCRTKEHSRPLPCYSLDKIRGFFRGSGLGRTTASSDRSSTVDSTATVSLAARSAHAWRRRNSRGTSPPLRPLRQQLCAAEQRYFLAMLLQASQRAQP